MLTRRNFLFVLLVVLLSLLEAPAWPGAPSTAGQPWPGPWTPPLGIVLAVVFWYGRRFALLLFPAGILAALRLALIDPESGPGLAEALALGAFEGLLQVGGVAALAWMYREKAAGEVTLGEPRSATVFLLLTALVLGGLAVVRDAPGWVESHFDRALLRDALGYWLDHCLGIVALAPLLLVFGTPLVDRSATRPRRFKRGDLVEIVCLTVTTSVLSVVLIATRQTQAWHLWGGPLLLIVWAGIRQGHYGASMVAATGAVAGLTSLAFHDSQGTNLLIQANLLAQCATAVLVATSVDWVRLSEQRYRQVVSQIPVTLYSARVHPGEDGTPAAEVLFVNPRCRDVLGCAPEDLLGDYEKWVGRVHAEDREVLRAALRQLARQAQPVVCEYRLAPRPGDALEKHDATRSPLPDYRTRWVRDVLVPNFDDEGGLEGWEGMASDITEQRVLADDLRRTTSMFHTLVANLPAGVFFVSARSGRPILVNQRARHLLGQREDVAAGIYHLPQVYRLHRPDGTPYPAEELPVWQVLQCGSVSTCDDIVVHRPDGRRVPLISWAAPVDLGHGNKIDAVVWVLEDLTELRQAEAARRETEGRLRTVIESLAEGLLVQDRHELVIDSNPAAGSLLGPLLEKPGTMADGPWLREDGSVLPADDHPIRRALRTGAPARNVVLGLPRAERVECELDADGSGTPLRGRGPRWLLINSLPLAARIGGTPAGVITTLVDVSDQVQAQQRIRASEGRYHGLVDSLPLMVLQFDRDLRLTLANPALTAISGYTIDEVRDPERWMSLVHPDDLPAVQDHFRNALAGQDRRCEVRYRGKDGQERINYAFLQPLWRAEEAPPSQLAGEAQAGGQVVGVTALVLDVTRERRLEQELQRAQRLELVGRLSSSIAHDFGNLLTALLGVTHLAEVKARSGEPVQAELAQIKSVGDQATQLARQILDFCKHRPIPIRRIDANHAVHCIADIMPSLLPSTIRLECSLHDAPLWVQADEIQLQQVVMNLCLNARDAMPQGGTMSIRTHPPPHGPEGAFGLWMCLTVEDSGEGMPPEVRRRIFEPFFTTRERGTGLGLSVVQDVVASFGGQVQVHSEPGRGSRFDIWLPLTDGGPPP